MLLDKFKKKLPAEENHYPKDFKVILNNLYDNMNPDKEIVNSISVIAFVV